MFRSEFSSSHWPQYEIATENMGKQIRKSFEGTFQRCPHHAFQEKAEEVLDTVPSTK